jgi:hypothetical protein
MTPIEVIAKEWVSCIEALIAKTKREAWCAGRDAGAELAARNGGSVTRTEIHSLEPPEDL